MVNKVILIGNLGKDPITHNTQQGKKIVRFSLATTETWKDKNTGEKKSLSEWHNVVIFNQHEANYAENFLRKGSFVYLEGKIKSRKWTNNEGLEKYVTEIVLSDYNGFLKNLTPKSKNNQSYSNQFQNNQTQEIEPVYDLDDDIPF